jgi:ribosomal protein S14
MSRPKGSKNRTYPAATPGRPARCPACGSTEAHVLATLPAFRHNGLDPDGQPYTAIVRQRRRCDSCGQTHFAAIYQHEPAENT